MTDLDLIIFAARCSGEIALRFFNANPKVWDKGDNQGPVTEADLAVNAMLHEMLMEKRPDYGWLSEETPDNSARIHTDYQFIIDPIDGTKAFINGDKDWAHSIAVAHKGQITAGVVYLPARDLLYAASYGQGATLNGQALKVSETDQKPKILARKNSIKWQDGVNPDAYDWHFRTSLAYRMCLIASKDFDAMMTLRPTWEWDIAAGTLIATEAGVNVSDQSGNILIFNTENAKLDGIVAAEPCLHREVISRIKTA